MRLRNVALFLVLALGGMQGSTQYVAHVFGYAPELGESLLTVDGASVYPPWAWFTWSARWEANVPYAFQAASAITFGSLLLGVLLLLLLSAARKTPKSSGAFGTARWATEEELGVAGLLEGAGVVLCQTKDAVYEQVPGKNGGASAWKMKRTGSLLRHNGPEHVFCFAPTRSGKGVGLVIPTLLSWTESVLVYDIKKELWTATAGFRRTFSHCLRFEPSALDSVRFNPLAEVRAGAFAVRDAQNIADILVDPEGTSEKRDHWQTTAHSLLVAAILHVIYAEDDKSLGGVATFLSEPSRSQFDTLNRMLETQHLGTGPDPAIAGAAREMLNKSDNELSGVFSTAMACLGLYRDPIVARNTSQSDFRIADLMLAERPVSLYLVVPPSDIDRLRPLVRLLLNQIGRRLTETMLFGAEKGYRHRLLFLLDEFPSLGRLAFFETELAYLAGYGIKCFLIAQSLSQIEKAYGQQNAILDNTHVRITYGALDERTAKRISELLGQATEVRTQVTHSGKRGSLWLDNRSESIQEHARALLTPGEILQLPADEALLMIGGLPPYRAKKVMYYQDARFKRRGWLPAPDSPHEQRAELVTRSVLASWDAVHRPAIARIEVAAPTFPPTLRSKELAATVVSPPPLESGTRLVGGAPSPSPSEDRISEQVPLAVASGDGTTPWEEFHSSALDTDEEHAPLDEENPL